jgi:hypothetical protein
MPPVADGVVVTDLVVHSGSWPPPSGSGALTTPSTTLFNWVTSLAVSGHVANTSIPDEPASQVVNIASPAQLAGVQAGYIMDATTFSSSPVAAAVDAGAAEGVAVAAKVGAGVAVPVDPAVGFAGEPQETTSAGAIIAMPQKALLRDLTRPCCSWT